MRQEGPLRRAFFLDCPGIDHFVIPHGEESEARLEPLRPQTGLHLRDAVKTPLLRMGIKIRLV
jgi:hypothetical protein